MSRPHHVRSVSPAFRPQHNSRACPTASDQLDQQPWQRPARASRSSHRTAQLGDLPGDLRSVASTTSVPKARQARVQVRPGERYGYGDVGAESYWKFEHAAAFQLWSVDTRFKATATRADRSEDRLLPARPRPQPPIAQLTEHAGLPGVQPEPRDPKGRAGHLDRLVGCLPVRVSPTVDRRNRAARAASPMCRSPTRTTS